MKLTYIRLLVDDYPACSTASTPRSRSSGSAARRSRPEPADRSDWGIRVGYVRDPDGNLIELNQPLPQDAT